LRGRYRSRKIAGEEKVGKGREGDFVKTSMQLEGTLGGGSDLLEDEETRIDGPKRKKILE